MPEEVAVGTCVVLVDVGAEEELEVRGVVDAVPLVWA
jgi:hypothetical protein